MRKATIVICVLFFALLIVSCSNSDNKVEPIKLQNTNFKNTIKSTSDRDNLPMIEAGQSLGTTVGIYNVNGNIEKTKQYHIKAGQDFKKFISLGNLISEDRVYKLIMLVDYKQHSFSVDDNAPSEEYNFKIGAGKTLEIPIKITDLDSGMHDIVVIMVKNPNNKSLDEEYRKKTDLSHLIIERFNVIVGDSDKPATHIEFTNEGVKEPQNLGGIFLSKKNDYKRWLSEDVKPGEILDYFIHVGNSLEKDHQTYALVVLYNWKQIDIVEGKNVLYYKLNKDDSFVLPATLNTPESEGVEDLTALLIQNPNEKLTMYNRDTEFSLRVGVNAQ